MYVKKKNILVAQEESDIGVTIGSDLKHGKDCKSACIKASTMFGFISRNFERKTLRVMLSPWNSLV